MAEPILSVPTLSICSSGSWSVTLCPPATALCRFAGGAVGYLGYDLGRQIERLPHAPPDDLCLPET